MTWHAHINCPSDRVVLYLSDLATHGKDYPRLASPGEVAAFLAAHPEVEAVSVSDSRFPRRPVPVEAFRNKWLKKFFR